MTPTFPRAVTLLARHSAVHGEGGAVRSLPESANSQAAPVWSTDWGNRVRLIGNHEVLDEASVSLSHKMLVLLPQRRRRVVGPRLLRVEVRHW
jgi:hypothetical protein